MTPDVSGVIWMCQVWSACQFDSEKKAQNDEIVNLTQDHELWG